MAEAPQQAQQQTGGAPSQQPSVFEVTAVSSSSFMFICAFIRASMYLHMRVVGTRPRQFRFWGWASQRAGCVLAESETSLTPPHPCFAMASMRIGRDVGCSSCISDHRRLRGCRRCAHLVVDLAFSHRTHGFCWDIYLLRHANSQHTRYTHDPPFLLCFFSCRCYNKRSPRNPSRERRRKIK